MTRVAVLGAGGRMGRLTTLAVQDDPELDLVAGVDPSRAGRSLGEVVGRPDMDLSLVASPADLGEGVEVAVDFTTPDAVMGNIRALVDRGIHAVVGTTGIGPSEHEEIRGWISGSDVGVVVAPNFSIGAVVAQRLAEEAARYFPAAEVVELHHDGKLDAPSGTAAATARRIAAARSEGWSGPTAGEGFRGGEVDGIRVHSVRLPGLVAHQEVIFGGLGQILSIRHDTLDRTSFMPGVLLAVKEVSGRPGLTVGLDALLGLPT